MSPVNNVLAIPIPPHGTTSATVTFPPDAVSASVYGSGLGTGANPWPYTPALGGALTGVFNPGVPAFMLGFGVAAQSCKPLHDIIQGLAQNKKFIGGVVTGFPGYLTGTSVASQSMNWSAFTGAVKFLFDTAVTRALVWVEGTLAAEEAVSAAAAAQVATAVPPQPWRWRAAPPSAEPATSTMLAPRAAKGAPGWAAPVPIAQLDREARLECWGRCRRC